MATLTETRNIAPFLTPAPMAAIEAAPTPEPTATHFPIPHKEFIDLTRGAAEKAGFEITDEVHSITKTGARTLGVLAVRPRDINLQDALFLNARGSQLGGRQLLMGYRNSHDKAYAAGILSGSHVTVCANGAFHSEFQLRTKHTRHIMRRLPALLDLAVTRFIDRAKLEAAMAVRYSETELAPSEADHFIVDAIRHGAISPSKVGQVVKLYDQPPHQEFKERTLWSLLNAFTEVYKECAPDTVVARSRKLDTLASNWVSQPVDTLAS